VLHYRASCDKIQEAQGLLRKIRRRYEELSAALPALLPQVGSALRECLKDGYGARELRADLLAGVTIGVVALPLSMALAIASGVAPQYGLYTAIVAGAIAALLGGSRFQVSGPTAAFVVVLAPIVHQFGLAGLLLATALAGALQLALGLVRAGRLILFIPAPVTTGFTAGIAVVIATLQLKDFLGLSVPAMPESYVGKVAALARALPTLNLAELGLGALTLAILLLWPRLNRRIPSPLVALTASACAALAVRALWPQVEVHTLGNTFSYLLHGVSHGGVPQLPPLPRWPWAYAGPDGQAPAFSTDLVVKLIPAAFAIAMLGAIESLLSATVADGMTGKHHDPDAELLAQGAANLVAPFFGGIAATGALARTATGIRAGARSPLAALFHSVFVLLAMLAFAPLLGYLPMAGFAALLLLVAWNMSDARHFVHILRVAPRSDVLVMLVCFALTVLLDMVRAVAVGVVLAAVLFIRRMAEISGATRHDGASAGLGGPLPPATVLYRIAGPLFFGAANKALGALEQVDPEVRCVILDFSAVPAMDVTGLVNLETTLGRLHEQGRLVLLAGVQPQPQRTLEKAAIAAEPGRLEFLPDAESARLRAGRGLPAEGPPPARVHAAV
jgi:SulP family sulfate permease